MRSKLPTIRATLTLASATTLVANCAHPWGGWVVGGIAPHLKTALAKFCMSSQKP
jgi:hypothetical protein